MIHLRIPSRFPSRLGLTLGALALAGTSCAKGRDPLTGDQKNQLQGALNSAGIAYAAVQKSAISSKDASGISTLDQMVSLIQKKKCTLKLITPPPNDSPTELIPGPRTYLSVEAYGKQCPINLDFNMDVQSDPSSGTFITAIDYDYAVNSSDYARLNDVKTIALRGGMSLFGLKSDAMRGAMDLSGKITLASAGEIPVYITGRLNGSKGEVHWQFQFPTFIADFKLEIDNGIKYTLNDEDLSPEEFDAYFRRGGDPFFFMSGFDRTHG